MADCLRVVDVALLMKRRRQLVAILNDTLHWSRVCLPWGCSAGNFGLIAKTTTRPIQALVSHAVSQDIETIMASVNSIRRGVTVSFSHTECSLFCSFHVSVTTISPSHSINNPQSCFVDTTLLRWLPCCHNWLSPRPTLCYRPSPLCPTCRSSHRSSMAAEVPN